jgi:hypothetical protein
MLVYSCSRTDMVLEESNQIFEFFRDRCGSLVTFEMILDDSFLQDYLNKDTTTKGFLNLFDAGLRFIPSLERAIVNICDTTPLTMK